MSPVERIEVLVAQLFLAPPEPEALYEITLRDIAKEMADHD
jgi:hypothetical protein